MLIRFLSAALLAMAGLSVPALAQTSIQACDTQDGIEQLLQSEGDLSPDGCRTVSLTRVETELGELCVLNFTTEENSDILGSLADAALPTKWWISCEDLNLE